MATTMEDSNTKGLQTFSFEAKVEKFSAFQPIDIKPLYGRDWILNGTNNENFKTYKDAYDDSPTNSSIINDYTTYVNGEGLIDIGKNSYSLAQYISDEDVLLISQDLNIYGGYAIQIIWNENTKTPIKVKYIPIYKLGIKYDQTNLEVTGYWFSYDWKNRSRYAPTLYPIFDGNYKDKNVEILVVRQPTAEPFFSIPDYISGISWAKVEGRISNYGINFMDNGVHDVTIVNYNQGRQSTPEAARVEAEKVRKMIGSTENSGRVIVSFNDSIEESVTLDKIPVAELSQNITFLTEEAERKLQIAHGMPKILFSGDQSGGGFSNNAEEYAMALKILYRKKINPKRQIIANGLNKVFQLINADVNVWFKDFEEENKLDNTESNNEVKIDGVAISLDEKTLSAQANLKGSVGGVQALLDIQSSYSAGTTTYESAISMLDIIFGYNREQAVKLLGKPEKKVQL